MHGVSRADILGCPFDAVSFEGVLKLIERAVFERSHLQIVPGSIDTVMKARCDRDFGTLLNDVDLVVADGVPITWAAAMLGTPLCRRVSGTDLVWWIGDISERLGVSVALVGGAPGIAQQAAEKIRAAFPNAVLHALPTPMSLGPIESLTLASEIRSLGARIVLAALGAPRQEFWIRDYLDISGANVGAGIGSAFDIISGARPRAPKWMADNGLEWLHRMLQEPKRLGRRYIVDDSPFLAHLFVEIIARRFLRRAS
jgi:N-acetylglucosaminyldiphosphoundecaprenol N-acetyl-beta-D-mannosaminyltransferase